VLTDVVFVGFVH